MPEGLTEDELMQRLMAQRAQIHALAYAITRDFHLAEDVLQEVALTLSKQRPGIDRQRPFAPWALGVARNKALETLRKKHHAPTPLDEETLRMVEESLIRSAAAQAIEQRRGALARCLELLGARARDVLEMKYGQKMQVEAISRHIERSPTATHSLLQRLRGKLAECMERQASAEAGS